MAKDASALLRQYADPDVIAAAHFAAGDHPSSIQRFHSAFSAPILYGFVRWVLLRAEQEDVYDLYFLARDGYLLYQIASFLCQRHSLRVCCHYLYGSRMAWRLPSYHLLGEQELRSILFIPSQKMTPTSLLSRAGCTQEEQQYFCQAASCAWKDPNQSLSRQEMEAFADELLNRPDFQRAFRQHSQEAYSSTLSYFQQEGLLTKRKFALVDTGWTGSMQRTLRQLLAHAGVFPKLFGFYFGMYERPKAKEDGQYFSWYFHPGSHWLRCARFNNNLLESLCLAPHPMTVGYDQDENGYSRPRFALNSPAASKECALTEQVLASFSRKVPFDIPTNRWLALTKELLSHVCTNPSPGDVRVLQQYSFCDDLVEGYRQSIVSRLTREEFKPYLFFPRLYRRIVRGKEPPPLFWPEGSLAISEIPGKTRYRLSFFFWELFRQAKLLFKRKGG